jgi:hypothetical protein
MNRFWGIECEKHTSGAKSPLPVRTAMPGINPRPTVSLPLRFTFLRFNSLRFIFLRFIFRRFACENEPWGWADAAWF